MSALMNVSKARQGHSSQSILELQSSHTHAVPNHGVGPTLTRAMLAWLFSSYWINDSPVNMSMICD